jgi:hypothetical protein
MGFCVSGPLFNIWVYSFTIVLEKFIFFFEINFTIGLKVLLYLR